MIDKKHFTTIDEYISTFPVDTQVILEKMRQTIQKAAPEAVEIISYNIPTFDLDGKHLVFFAGWKHHISMYPTPSGDEVFQQELSHYKRVKSTIQFPLDKPIPYDFVEQIVTLHMKESPEKKEVKDKPRHNLGKNYVQYPFQNATRKRSCELVNERNLHMPELHTLLTDLAFGESPRWHNGRLWFSDFGAQEVVAVDLEGKKEVIAHISGTPMGLGFLPDGRLLIVSMRDGLLLRREQDGRIVTHANLSSLSRSPWNDMVVDGRGNAYIGNMGFDFPAGEFAPGILALVTPDGEVRQVADGFAFANGMVVTSDNKKLILAESYAHRLTAFDIDASGNLSNRLVWANLGGDSPDGICLDAEHAVWYADVGTRRCVRVRQGGEVLQTVDLDRGCFACMLGGVDRRTLFLMAAEYPPASWGPEAARTGQVLTIEVTTPSVGWP